MHKEIPEDMSIKKLGIEHLDQFNDLLRYAFQVTEEMLSRVGWEDDKIKKSKSPILKSANVLGWFDGDTLASQIAIYPLKMNVHGAIYDMGFVTGVATYPEYAGMGLMSKLMAQCLFEMKEQGQSISLLYPFSIPLYRHKGWEIISDKMTFKVKDSQLPANLHAPGSVSRVDSDSPDIFKIHDEFVLKTHGCIMRNALVWEEYWRWDVDDVTVAIYYDTDERPLGYMVYLLKEDVMYIKEMIYLNQEAWRGLWSFVTAHKSMITEVNGSNYSSEPLAFWLDDGDIKETIKPYMMARIVDVEKFLSEYKFRKTGTKDSVTFIVSDPLLEWNNHHFNVEFDGTGQFKLVDSEARKKVELSIGTLTTMLMGYKRPDTLKAMERIAADEETLAFLEEIIPDEKAYISDYM